MAEKKKIYFVSDVHLGLYPYEKSRVREKIFVAWLEEIRKDAAGIFLVGDIFDFWWEYKKVVPRGFTRFFGKIAEITDAGIPVHFFVGNHDMWGGNYLASESGMIIHNDPFITEINGMRFFISHGDGLGPGDFVYKILRMIFRNKVLQWMYTRLHPNLGMAIGHNWAKHSRYSKGFEPVFKGEDKERLILFAKEKLKTEHFDYFIFGHRHIPLVLKLNEQSTYINTGDWLTNFTYVVVDDKEVKMENYKPGLKFKASKADL